MNSSAFIRKNFRRTALASVVALGAFGASSSFAAEATTSATGTVIVPIAIAKSADLVFGKFAPGAGGSVTVSTSGARTGSGVILSTVGSSPTAAQFDVTGDNDATYDITWGGVTELSDGETTPNTMALERISDLTAGGATTGEVAAGTLGTGGTQSIYLGGTLTVAIAQPAGTYTGDVTATVEYN
ncbi:MAG: DUF4402 domain-containing protein [Halomonas sp.]|uniref:DUF4402 domain-containing protein n=1 Tax=Halomonas sp. TaxID=1486246 RepID=UPI00287007B9|nr:DUF4402 domain-containing protein [Halomonas sp.]MDR9438012.1 DUF4402 domain-containing protein [Halomonas sp.]